MVGYSFLYKFHPFYLAFQGGIHYGISGALYEISTLKDLQRKHAIQCLYSFLPGVLAYSITSIILLSSPLTLQTLILGFCGLSLTQLVSFLVDKRYVKSEALPKWYMQVRIPAFIYLIIVTGLLLTVMATNLDLVQKKNSNERISTLKSLLALGDVEFLEKVNDTRIQYDPEDMKILQARFERQEQFDQLRNESRDL